jgi:hypothetical protein
MTQKVDLRGKEQIKVDHKNIKKHPRGKNMKLLEDRIYVNIPSWNPDVERENLQQLCKLSSHVSIEILVTKDAMIDEAQKGSMQET